MAGSGAKFKIEELQMLRSDHLKDCLVFLGKDELDRDQAEYLWHAVVQVHLTLYYLRTAETSRFFFDHNRNI